MRHACPLVIVSIVIDQLAYTLLKQAGDTRVSVYNLVGIHKSFATRVAIHRDLCQNIPLDTA